MALPCLASRLYYMKVHIMAKKRSFSELDLATLKQEKKNRIKLCLKEIIAAVNSLIVDNRSPADA